MQRLLVVLAATLCLLAAPVRAGAPASPPLLLVGIDGATWRVLDPLLARGRLPVLAGLIDRGYAAPLRSMTPTFSPVIWTTIATGKLPEEHGIRHFVSHDAAGEIVPVTSNQRRVKALWNIASERGRRVGVFGWWITWPAEPVLGVMVSSYASLGRGEGAFDRARKGGFREDLPDETWPREHMEVMRRLLPAAREEGRRAAAEVFRGFDPRAARPAQRDVVEDSRATLTADATFQAAMDRTLGERIPELTLLYLAGLDVLSHRFWKYRGDEPDARFRVSAKERALLGEVIDRYARLLDARLGRSLERFGREGIVLVVSDHGFHADRIEGRSDDQVSGHHRDAPPGILVLAGPDIRHTDRRRIAPGEAPSVLDIAPTMLYLLGLELADDMSGHLIEEALEPERLRRVPPRRIPTWESQARPTPGEPPRPSAVDPELEERLRSLGYLR